MNKRLLSLALILVLCLTLLAGCGGGSTEEASQESGEPAQTEAAAEPAEAADPVIGTWFADTATKDGVTVDAKELFSGRIFYLDFLEDECFMYVGTDYALLDWERTEDGITLKGDEEYQITFPDDSGKTMVLNLKGFDVLLELSE